MQKTIYLTDPQLEVMNSKTLILATSILLLLMPVTSQTIELKEANLTEYEDRANQHTEELPSFVKDLVGDQDINVYIDHHTSESEDYNLSVEMNGTTVEEIESSSLEEPDIEVWTSSKIISNITESEKPVDQMQSAIDSGDIEYQANDTWTSIKLFFAETVMGFL